MRHRWNKVFKNGPSKTCGRQPLKNLKWYGLYHFKFYKGRFRQILLGPFLNTLSQIKSRSFSAGNKINEILIIIKFKSFFFFESQSYWTSTCNIYLKFKSSRPEVFCKKGVFRDFAKFTGKHLCQRHFFNKVAGLRSAIVLKKPPETGVFLWILWNF